MQDAGASHRTSQAMLENPQLEAHKLVRRLSKELKT